MKALPRWDPQGQNACGISGAAARKRQMFAIELFHVLRIRGGEHIEGRGV